MIATAAVLALVTGGVIAWFAIDSGGAVDEVGPNVTLDGKAIGRTDVTSLDAHLRARAEEIAGTAVTISFGGSRVETTMGALGVEVDEEATKDALLSVDRSGRFFPRLWSWVSGMWEPRSVETVWNLDPQRAADHLDSLPESVVAVPVEPSVIVTGDGVQPEPGSDGLRLDSAVAALELERRIRPGVALELEVDTKPIPPQDTDEVAEQLAATLNATVRGGATVRLLGSVGRMSEVTLLGALEVSGPVSDPVVTFNQTELQDALLGLFANVTRPGEAPTFGVDEEGRPVVERPGTPPQGCCGVDAGDVLISALEGGQRALVEIPPAPVGDPTLEAWARGDGIVEVVGAFTTQHACCQSRVTNIHRIADLIQGRYLAPGETFSVNDFIGERTTEKGFVAAGVIERGRFTDDVGGGISQFATTLFNAAFFAGLDLDEYQSHSIYISRYPYGREATLSFPKPDLVITNSTLYPVLLWPTYTDTSITVSIYSTRHIDVEETGQDQRPFNRCTDVETFRARTYPDGTTLEDSVVARYRPGEGLDCNGNPTPQP